MSEPNPTVAVVQWPFAWVSSRPAFVQYLATSIARATEAGARLVLWPGHTGDALLGLQRPDLAGMTLDAGLDAAWRPDGQPLSDADRRAQGEALAHANWTIFGALAAAFEVTIAAGSLLLPDARGLLIHQGVIFNPDGAIAGVQHACHRSAWERAHDVAAGTRLDTVSTPVGRVGLLVGEDWMYPEVARILALQGADILLAPVTRRASGDAARLAGLWRDVQANQVFGLESCLVTEGDSPSACGPSTILCPAELTADTRGVIAEAPSADGAAVVSAVLDVAGRRALFASYDVYRYFNRELYETQLAEAYP